VVQDEIAASVSSALAIKLSGGSSASRPPSNFEAHEKFLQGEFFFFVARRAISNSPSNTMKRL
jgi:hypothetical protein